MLITAHPTTSDLKAKLFRGLADPTRLTILETLRDSPRAVGEVVEMTGLGQSNVSNHLACLKDCGLVASEKRGRFVHYRLSDPRVAELLFLSETLLAEVAQGVYACTHYGNEAAQ